MPSESLGGIPDISIGHKPERHSPEQWRQSSTPSDTLLSRAANNQLILKYQPCPTLQVSFHEPWWTSRPLLHDQNPGCIGEKTRTDRITVNILTDATCGLDFFCHAVWGSQTYVVAFQSWRLFGVTVAFYNIRGLKLKPKCWAGAFRFQLERSPTIHGGRKKAYQSWWLPQGRLLLIT